MAPQTLEVCAMFASAIPDQLNPKSVTLMVSGEIDMAEKDEFYAAIIAVATPGLSTVIVDMTEVTFLGSSGIRGLIAAWKVLAEWRVALRIGNCARIIDRVLDATGVRAEFDRAADGLAVPLSEDPTDADVSRLSR